MKSREEIRGLIALLSVCTKQELVRLVVEEGMDIEAYRERENQAGELLDETRDYVDTLKRRADLIHAISDTVSENALESEQLEAIAAIIWPAPVALQNICKIHSVENCVDCLGVDTSKPTNLGMG